MKTMKKMLKVAIILIGIITIISCGSKSGHKVEQTELKKSEPQEITINPSEEEIIGTPMSVAYAIPLNSWNLSLDVKSKDGYAYNIEIDSTTAMKILKDKSIVAVKIKGKDITLLKKI